MGNLGWGQDEHTLLTRVREALEAARIPNSTYKIETVTTFRTPGSMADVLFNTFDDLEAASLQMMARRWLHAHAGTHPEGRRKNVWLH